MDLQFSIAVHIVHSTANFFVILIEYNTAFIICILFKTVPWPHAQSQLYIKQLVLQSIPNAKLTLQC